MQPDSSPEFKEVVLAGGGHAHALMVRQWGMQPLPGVRLTLVSPDPLTPYSGMLPGLVAGHYAFDDIHIDLARLCHWAGVRFIQESVTGIDGNSNILHLTDSPALGFDVLSLDTGSTPDHAVPGVGEHAIPVKPIAGFWQRWQAVFEALQRSSVRKVIAVVGGGAGSVEIVLAMARACRHGINSNALPEFHLLSQSATILPGYPGRVQQAARRACAKYGVVVHESCTVTAVAKDSLQTAAGMHLAVNHVFWCTQAAAPDWPAKSGLACDDQGFVSVNACLQSISHPHIFAAGDMADMRDNPRPKAGVFAVRQAPVLYINIRNLLLGKPLENYLPQDRFLSLLALGGKMATGNRGAFSVSGGWVWHWKNRIDRKFMRRFHELPS